MEPPKEVKEEGSSGLGIPQLAVGVLSLLLAGVFLVTSGPGGGGPTPPPASVQVTPPPLSPGKELGCLGFNFCDLLW